MFSLKTKKMTCTGSEPAPSTQEADTLAPKLPRQLQTNDFKVLFTGYRNNENSSAHAHSSALNTSAKRLISSCRSCVGGSPHGKPGFDSRTRQSFFFLSFQNPHTHPCPHLDSNLEILRRSPDA